MSNTGDRRLVKIPAVEWDVAYGVWVECVLHEPTKLWRQDEF